MKKIQFALGAIALFGTLAGTAQTTTQKILSTLYENWTANGWQNQSQYQYTYDNNFYLTAYNYQSWNTSAWKDVSKTAITNDAAGNAL